MSEAMGLERYALGPQIGAGRFGSAHDLRDADGRPLVLKRVSLARVLADHGRTLDSFGSDREAKVLELFDREVRVLKTLDHPAIPRLVDSFVERKDGDVELCLVTEHVEGRDLEQLLAERSAFSQQRVAEIMLEVADVLAYLHQRTPAVIHRDVKPGNLVVDEKGHVHLVDFGAVLEATLPQAEGSTIIGTFGYMPLEQYEGRAVPASDVHALGMTALRLLTGAEPRDLDRRRIDGLDLEPWLADLLRRMLAPEAAKRPRDGAAVVRAIERRENPGRVRWERLRDIAIAAAVGALAASLTFAALTRVGAPPTAKVDDPAVRGPTASRWPATPR